MTTTNFSTFEIIEKATPDDSKSRAQSRFSNWRRRLKEQCSQQTLPAWQPRLSAPVVLPVFFVVAVCFIGIGIALTQYTMKAHELRIPYTDCVTDVPSQGNYTCAEIMRRNTSETCTCTIHFNMTDAFSGIVYMYYELTNFHQNHRRYIASVDPYQLLGQIGTAQEIVNASKDCIPFQKEIQTTNESIDESDRFIFPCGAIANSMFNDTFVVFKIDTESETGSVAVKLERKGIAWESDKTYRYKNPPQFSNRNDSIWQSFTHPPAWKRSIWDLDPEDESNNGVQNEDFIVWMRAEAFPEFRKLHRRWEPTFNQSRAGSYFIQINYNYNVSPFRGTKSVIFSGATSLGGRNAFLGKAYLFTGIVSFLIGLVVLLAHVKHASSSNDLTL